jgi:hypothetical protein
MDVPTFLRIAIQLAQALGEVHRKQILRSGRLVGRERKMAYNKFTLSKAEKQFQLRIDETQDLFSTVAAEVEISDSLQTYLNKYVPLALAINTEKARSEMIIAPILLEFRDLAPPPISLFSGRPFNKPIVQK